MFANAVDMVGHSAQNHTTAPGLVAVAFEGREADRSAPGRCITQSIYINDELPVVLVGVAPAQRAKSPTVLAVVVAVPFEGKRSYEFEVEVAVEIGTGDHIHRVADQPQAAFSLAYCPAHVFLYAPDPGAPVATPVNRVGLLPFPPQVLRVPSALRSISTILAPRPSNWAWGSRR